MTQVAARHPVVLAITGASGAPYAVRLLQQLLRLQVPTWLIVSSHGFRLLDTESDIPDLQALRARVGAEAFDACVTVFDDNDRGAAPASGSVNEMPLRLVGTSSCTAMLAGRRMFGATFGNAVEVMQPSPTLVVIRASKTVSCTG